MFGSCLSDQSLGEGQVTVPGCMAWPLSPGCQACHGAGFVLWSTGPLPCQTRLGSPGTVGDLGTLCVVCAGICPGKWRGGCLPKRELSAGPRGWWGTGLDSALSRIQGNIGLGDFVKFFSALRVKPRASHRATFRSFLIFFNFEVGPTKLLRLDLTLVPPASV